jgi:hypothetical protein
MGYAVVIITITKLLSEMDFIIAETGFTEPLIGFYCFFVADTVPAIYKH